MSRPLYPSPIHPIAPTRRYLPSLDGLRAISVLVVILGHSRSDFLNRIPFGLSFRNGDQGVAVFFVISGFLITHLLLRELNHASRIDLRRFYLRRAFRILPAFYAFLLTVAILGYLHKLTITPARLLITAAFLRNYVQLPTNWVLGHCWSLTLEEQFYLLWPLCLRFFSKRTSLRIAAAIILLSPFSRVLTYFAWPAMRPQIDMMLHTHLDTIMTGCLLALLLDIKPDFKLWPRFHSLALQPLTPWLAILFLFFVDTPLETRFRGTYQMTLGISLENLAIALLLLNVVFLHQSPLGHLLNLQPLRHLGRISYGLYLWQQLFDGPYTRHFPLNLVFILAAAELSYYLIELPSFHLRDRLLATFPSSSPHTS